MSRIETKWQCGECHELHDTEDDAEDCCRPNITQVYLCPKCGDACQYKDEAIECCEEDGEKDPDEEHADALEVDLRKFPSYREGMTATEYVEEYNSINEPRDWMKFGQPTDSDGGSRAGEEAV